MHTTVSPPAMKLPRGASLSIGAGSHEYAHLRNFKPTNRLIAMQKCSGAFWVSRRRGAAERANVAKGGSGFGAPRGGSADYKEPSRARRCSPSRRSTSTSPNRDAILVALADREARRIGERMRALIDNQTTGRIPAG